MENYDRAIEAYDQVIRLDPKNAFAYSNRGYAYYRKKDYDLAVPDLEQAMELDPKLRYPYRGRGNVYIAQGDIERAIAYYDHAIELDPKYEDAYESRGDAYRAKGDYGRATADYDQAIVLDPKDADFFTSRGYARFDIGHYQDAASDFAQALTLKSETPRAVLGLYIAQMRLGLGTATADLETNAKRAKRMEWPHPLIDMFLGGRTEEATLEDAHSPDELCEAQFFVAQRLLLQGKRTATISRLRLAADVCPNTSYILPSVRAELTRMTR
jgi:tetratricopeptide (TPR) repeat protein